MIHESSRRLAIQLKEVLDRIKLPPIESIPDAQTMAKAEFKRWTLPNSEIRIQRVEKGPRTGEYLFTPETLSRLPEFYDKVKELPYKTGASAGWYDFSTYSPAGVALALHRIVPPRWLLDAPRYRKRFTFLDQPLWRWLGILAVLGAAFGAVHWCFRLNRYWDGQAAPTGKWADLLRPLSIVITAPVAALIFAEVLRVSGTMYEWSTRSLWTVFFSLSPGWFGRLAARLPGA
jgi:MscS family membrane protein